MIGMNDSKSMIAICVVIQLILFQLSAISAKDECQYDKDTLGLPDIKPPNINISVSLKLENNTRWFIPYTSYRGKAYHDLGIGLCIHTMYIIYVIDI